MQSGRIDQRIQSSTAPTPWSRGSSQSIDWWARLWWIHCCHRSSSIPPSNWSSPWQPQSRWWLVYVPPWRDTPIETLWCTTVEWRPTTTTYTPQDISWAHSSSQWCCLWSIIVHSPSHYTRSRTPAAPSRFVGPGCSHRTTTQSIGAWSWSTRCWRWTAISRTYHSPHRSPTRTHRYQLSPTRSLTMVSPTRLHTPSHSYHHSQWSPSWIRLELGCCVVYDPPGWQVFETGSMFCPPTSRSSRRIVGRHSWIYPCSTSWIWSWDASLRRTPPWWYPSSRCGWQRYHQKRTTFCLPVHPSPAPKWRSSNAHYQLNQRGWLHHLVCTRSTRGVASHHPTSRSATYVDPTTSIATDRVWRGTRTGHWSWPWSSNRNRNRTSSTPQSSGWGASSSTSSSPHWLSSNTAHSSRRYHLPINHPESWPTSTTRCSSCSWWLTRARRRVLHVRSNEGMSYRWFRCWGCHRSFV